mgnify:CR=1 FL=1
MKPFLADFFGSRSAAVAVLPGGSAVLQKALQAGTRARLPSRDDHGLVQLPRVPVIALTGSLMGGYASSLFANAWALSRHAARGHNRAATAVANKLARIAWAVWKHNQSFLSAPLVA